MLKKNSVSQQKLFNYEYKIVFQYYLFKNDFDFWFFNATFSYIMATSFSGGRSGGTRREPPTIGKQLVNFYHLLLRVECTLFSNLQNRARTHAVLVIGLYELLCNPTT